jgi:L,D-transpeptidase YcbB
MPRRNLPLLSLSLAALALAGCRHHGAHSHETSSQTTSVIHADAQATQLSVLRWPNFSDYAPLVQAFYNDRQGEVAWVDNKQATQQARAMVELFTHAGQKGLDAEDYDASRWAARLAHLPSASDDEVAQFDLAMTVTAMRYISDLHIGRVNPAHFAFGVPVAAKKYNLPQFLEEEVIASSDVPASLKQIEPNTEQYHALLDALGKYQAMAAKQHTAGAAPLPSPGKPLTVGASYAGASALRDRLVLEGELPADSAPSTRYDKPLADAVAVFQLRHGLTNDGKLTPQTVDALNVPLDVRVRAIEDTLERWRWLPDQYLNAPLLVNIPEFALHVFKPDHSTDFMMRVVVGDSVKDDRQTPVLAEMMKYVVLRPFWNVTPTIIKQEIVPHVEANRGYLEEKNFEVVDGKGTPVTDWSAERLLHGGLIVREKPGPKNSLGLIKFMFPNKYNIYLHSTPATELFSRTKRDFSHGCIRLQEPEKLADWLFQDDSNWTADKIHDEMENGQDNHIVPLPKPVPIVIFYATAMVANDGPEQGQVYFFNDIYGYDKEMEDVLSHGMPYPVKPETKTQSTDPS